MMHSIKFHFERTNWSNLHGEKRFIHGTAFRDGRKYCGPSLAEFLPKEIEKTVQWENALSRLNGFFAIVARTDKALVAAVDRVRSLPIYYGQARGCFFLSDSAEWVRRQVGDETMDPIAREEFLLAGYVTGRDTLYPNVKQLQAGEFLRINMVARAVILTTHRYYRFCHIEPKMFDKSRFQKDLDNAVENSVRRLVDYANGRQIVIPLSGGFDSRLIAVLLKRMEYANILTFTYGVAGNRESHLSQIVADALGLKWCFIEYNKTKWREAWQSGERWAYQRWGSGWSGLPHVQDWPAVRELQGRHLIADDAIFVPGHTGDFISGGHLPTEARPGHPASVDTLTGSIRRKHYSQAPMKNGTRLDLNYLNSRILEVAEAQNIKNGEDLANFFEKWEWQERQAKFIVNSVRVYEFYGYDWWLPLWDSDVMNFWQNVPLSIRKNKEWYDSYVSKVFLEVADISKCKHLGNVDAWHRIGLIWRKNSARILARAQRIFGLKYGAWKSMATLDRYPVDEVARLTRLGYSHNGIVAHQFLVEAKSFGRFRDD